MPATFYLFLFFSNKNVTEELLASVGFKRIVEIQGDAMTNEPPAWPQKIFFTV